jgi:hypothetical protein
MRQRSKIVFSPASSAKIPLLLTLVSTFIVTQQPDMLAKEVRAGEVAPSPDAATSKAAAKVRDVVNATAKAKGAMPTGKQEDGDCTLNFPEDRTYGRVFLLSKNEILNNSGLTGKKIAEARGKIAIKASDGIMFKGNAYLAEQPELFAELPPRCTKVLMLQNLELSDQSFSYAKKLANLGHLDLTGTDVTDASFKTISNFERLEYLSLIATNIDGSRFSELARLPMLRSLRVSGNALKYFTGLAALHQVKFLDISQSRITDSDLSSIGKMRNVDHLELRKTAITNNGLKALKGLKHLSELDVRGTKITVDGIAQLAGVPLKSFCFDGATVADEKSLSKNFPGIHCSDRDAVRDLAPTIFAPLH